MINSQLIPKLAYRMTAHCLPSSTVEALQNRIWLLFSKVTKLPRITPTKARYGPTKEGSLGLFEIPTRIATLTLTQLQRALHGEAPSMICKMLKQAWQREGSWCSRCAPLGQVLPKRKPIGGKRQKKKEARKQGKDKRGGMEGGGLHCRGAKLPSNAGLNC